MKWYKELYVSENVKRKQDKIISNIEKNKLQYGIFVLTLAINGKDLIDIYPSYELKQEYYKQKGLFVIGIAKGRKEAFSLVEEIVMNVYSETGACDIGSYVNNK